MEIKINLGTQENPLYRYCSVSDDPEIMSELYDSPEEALADLYYTIKTDGEKRGYSEEEIDAIVHHYEVKFHNYSGIWIADSTDTWKDYN